ncbi:MAG: SHOCT domain-containing protein [Euryarchaeota archaeon]|nr:SHOCT domain-containing protein [Euryarchaeota archaeon]
MRKKYVIAGIVVVIIGLVVALYGIYLVQGVEAYYDDINMTISHDANLTYQIGQIAEISGILLFLIGMCLIIVWGIIPYKKTIPKSSTVSYDEALNILRTRYAKGKVTKEQFEQMKKDLEEKYL